MAQPRIRSNTLGIPAVNQNPRPPNEPKFTSQTASYKPKTNSTGSIGSGAHAQSQGSFGSNGASYTPSASQGSGGSSLAGTAADPRDAQYWQDMAQLTFNRDMGLSGLNTEDAYSQQAYQSALSQRLIDEPIEVRRTRENANVAGEIYSTAHQEDLGYLGQQQTRTRGDLARNYNLEQARRDFLRQQYAGQYGLDASQSAIDAVGRAAANELNRPGPVVPYPTGQDRPPPPGQSSQHVRQQLQSRIAILQRNIQGMNNPQQKKKFQTQLQQLRNQLRTL